MLRSDGRHVQYSLTRTGAHAVEAASVLRIINANEMAAAFEKAMQTPEIEPQRCFDTIKVTATLPTTSTGRIPSTQQPLVVGLANHS